MPQATRAQIDGFLAHKRVAVVGVSRRREDVSRALFCELRRRRYDAVPVNPSTTVVDGVRCYGSVSEITPPVDAALLMTPPSVTREVVRDCDAARVRSVWMWRGAGVGAVDPAAIEFCEARGISVVAGECPFMFLPRTEWIHRVHGFFRKLLGKYPR